MHLPIWTDQPTLTNSGAKVYTAEHLTMTVWSAPVDATSGSGHQHWCARILVRKRPYSSVTVTGYASAGDAMRACEAAFRAVAGEES